MQFNDSAAQTPMGSERGVLENQINIFVGKSFSVPSSVCFLSYNKDKEKLHSVHYCLETWSCDPPKMTEMSKAAFSSAALFSQLSDGGFI